MRHIHCVIACFLLSTNWAGAQDWPQWRGPNRDNKLTDFAEPKSWPKELTKKWKVTVGIGEASPVLVGAKLYAFARQEDEEVTLCLDAKSGKEIWKDKYPVETIKNAARGYQGPRSTPAVGEGKVCTLGISGVVSCFDAASGKKLWRKETGQKPQFYTSTSPIIVDGKCVVFVGALTAFDLSNGDVKWKWSDAGTPYGSPTLMTVDGTKMVVTPAMGMLAGVNLADGKLLWSVKIGAGDYQSNYSTPLIDGATVYYSMPGGKKGGGGSTIALKIEKKGDGFNADKLWSETTSAAGYHTPVLSDGRIYGVSSIGKNFFCMDAKTGEDVWKDTATRGQCGSILNAGAVMLALTSDKDLIAFRSAAKKYEEVAKYRVSDSETWCVPIVVGNRVFVKDKVGSLALLTIE
jgi:outer membrane protein assembly factor BamB